MKQELSIVEIERLHDVLGYNEQMTTPLENLARAYVDYKLEVHDSPVLKYLFRNHRPGRHLEFGTQGGIGAELCARSCQAKIWTIGLPLQSDGDEPSRRTCWNTGYLDRITQIDCDIRAWDCSSFEDGFFDSVLINGRVVANSVAGDTEKAIRLLRPRGLCLWRGFCPMPEALEGVATTYNVVGAVLENIDTLQREFSALFWVKRTFLLLGVKR